MNKKAPANALKLAVTDKATVLIALDPHYWQTVKEVKKTTGLCLCKIVPALAELVAEGEAEVKTDETRTRRYKLPYELGIKEDWQND